MPNTITVSFINVASVESKLKRVQRALQEALVVTVGDAAVIVEQAAKENSPVDTGANRDSIRTDIVVSTPTHCVMRVAPHMAYSDRLEWGFLGQDSRGRTYHQEPRPYMRPAYESTKNAVKAQMIAEFRANLGAELGTIR